MQMTTFFEGLLAPFKALIGSSFEPATHFGQFILCVIIMLVLVCSVIKLFRY